VCQSHHVSQEQGLAIPAGVCAVCRCFLSREKTNNVYATDDEDDDDSDADVSSVEEDMRLLYVALTRAQRGLWLGVAETKNDLSGNAAKGTLKRSALSVLLNRQARGDLGQQLHALWGTARTFM